jgi:hypothetical protein
VAEVSADGTVTLPEAREVRAIEHQGRPEHRKPRGERAPEQGQRLASPSQHPDDRSPLVCRSGRGARWWGAASCGEGRGTNEKHPGDSRGGGGAVGFRVLPLPLHPAGHLGSAVTAGTYAGGRAARLRPRRACSTALAAFPMGPASAPRCFSGASEHPDVRTPGSLGWSSPRGRPAGALGRGPRGMRTLVLAPPTDPAVAASRRRPALPGRTARRGRWAPGRLDCQTSGTPRRCSPSPRPPQPCPPHRPTRPTSTWPAWPLARAAPWQAP